MTTLIKTPMEVRRYFFDLAEKIPTGATITSVQAFVSRQASVTAPLQATTLQAAVSAGVTTIPLNADPKAGALLILEPGGGLEERLKVISVSGAVAPFNALVASPAWYGHSSSASVSYEPGVSARMLADDTPAPSGTNVFLPVSQGCDLQDYTVSIVCPCNNGAIVEEEFTLQVRDVAPTETRPKQPTETRDAFADLSELLKEVHQAGATLTTGTAFAQATTSTSTTLSAQGNPSDPSVSLAVHPGQGALLVIDPTGPSERCYVSTVSGTGPFACTIQPSLEFLHGAGIGVTLFQGISVNFMTAIPSTISGDELVNRVRYGPAGKTFKLVWLGDTDQGEKLQHSGLVQLVEVTD